MFSNIEYIKTLILKEIAGTISPDEQSFLNKVVAESAEAAILRKELREKLDTEEVNSALQQLDEDLSIASVQYRERREKRAMVIRITAGIAALVVIVLGIYQLRGWKVEKKGVSTSSVQSTTGVQLTLSNGKIVDLSKEQGKVQAGQVTLNNSRKTLSYSTTGQPAAGYATLSVPAGKDYIIHLSDGTEIQLNSETSIKFPFAFNSNTREITIKGEAYLKVAKKQSQPFIVNIDNGPSVQVLGTEFNINAYDQGSIRVALVQGSVKLKGATDSIQLKPGFEAAYSYQQRKSLHEFDQDDVLSWRKGIVELKSATLHDVFEMLPRWFGVEVIVDNEGLSSRTFIGTLDRNKSIDEFLEGLKFTHDIDFYRKDGVIHIK